MWKSILFSARRVKIFQDPQVNGLILHILATVVAFLGLGAIVNKLSSLYTDYLFGAIVLVFLVLGGLHAWVLYTWHGWARRDGMLLEPLFTITVGLTGSVCFLLTTTRGGFGEYALSSFLAIGAFLVPFFLERSIREQSQLPEAVRPGWMINALEQVKSRGSCGARGSSRFLKLRFRTDDLGYLPRDILVRVSPKADLVPLGQLLENAVWHNNFKSNPENPIQYCYEVVKHSAGQERKPPEASTQNIPEGSETAPPEKVKTEKKVVPFVWEFRRTGLSLFKSRYLDPHHTLFGNKVTFRKGEEKGPDNVIISGEFAEVIVYRHKLQKTQ